MTPIIITNGLFHPKMKKFLLLFFVVLLSASPAFAKPDRAEREKMRKELQAFKIKFLVQEMDLSADKKTEFEHLYLQMEEEKHKAFEQTVGRVRPVMKGTAKSDEDYLAAADAMAGQKRREADIEGRYYAQFKKILSPRQLYKLKLSEEKFNRKLNEMRSKKGPSHKGKAPKKGK